MSLAPRWKKAYRDIQQRPGRSLLAVAAMAAGVLELGTMLYATSVLDPVLTTMYDKTRPAAATLTTHGVSDAVVDSVGRVPGVAAAEARPVVMARVRAVNGDWVPGAITIVRDFARQRLDLFAHEAGAWPPGPGDILLERSAMQVAKVKIGDPLIVRTPQGDDLTLRVAGTVHAAGFAPAWMEHMVPAFVSWDSPLRAGERGAAEQIRVRVAEHASDEGWIREVADSTKAMLERQGHAVSRVVVPPPGRHPHADQMAAFLYLLGSFGALSFLLGAVLTASMVHAMLAEQLKQVGILKAIGATTRQVAGIYLAQVGMLALVALAIGVPAGLALGRSYARFSAGILNANLEPTPFPWRLVAGEALIGLIVPLLVAMIPLARAARITVREALGDDFGPNPYGTRRLERLLARLRWIPRPLLLSLRGTFLRRGRLALSVVTLAIGGAAFIAALDVGEGWNEAVRRDFRCRRYDVTVQFAEPTPIATVARVLAGVPEVERAEYWAGAAPYLIGAAGVATDPVALAGPESASPLLALPLEAGRWLEPGDSAAAVVNHAVLVRNPSLRVGGIVRLRLDGRTVALPIVGVVRELAPMPVVYAPRAAVLAFARADGAFTRLARIVTRRRDEAGERAAARALDTAFERGGVEVALMQRMSDARQGILDHLVIIQSILTLAAIVVVIVGALALTSTLALSVVQRTREIGILGAIGARPATLAGHVWLEGMLIGLLSAALANVLAIPITWMLETATGNIFFKVPLDFYMGAAPSALWLGLVVVLATLSSVYPAWRASRLTVREALAHA